MKRLVIIVVLLCSQACANVYYVSIADGNDAHCTGLAHTAFRSASNRACPWQTIAKINRSSFIPGDSILFKRGETWRETLIFPSAGTALNAITIGAYGGTGALPTVSGADLITEWSAHSGTRRGVYTARTEAMPKRVWHGSVELTHASGARTDLGHNQFDWALGVLYIDIGQDPNGQTIEATTRAYALYVRKSYLIVDGLHFTKSNEMNIISAHQSNDHVTIRNCIVDDAGMSGVFLYGETAVISYWTLLHNTIAHNGLLAYNDHGVYVSHSSNNLFEGNLWEDNAAYGIQLQDNSNFNTVRYNYFHGNRSGALVIWDNTGNTFPTGNMVYGNVMSGNNVGINLGGSSATVHNMIVNNTIYDYTVAGLTVYNNANFGTFKNNIAWSQVKGACALYDNNGGAKMASDYNLIGPAATHFIYWNGVKHDSLTAYASATGNDTHSLAIDPQFVGASAANFTLAVGSPAKNAGLALGAPYDVGLDPQTPFPWKTLRRTSSDIGAFAFLPR